MKKILFITLIFLMGCEKPDLPIVDVVALTNIFEVTESKVTNGQDIHFKLPSDGVYILTLIDKENEQVISRERFIGQSGENIRKIYTNSIVPQYLYLTLTDNEGKELNKTIINIK